MKNSLLWRLCGIIAVGVVVLFWVVDIITRQTEKNMSFIKEEHQQQLLAYGTEAERLYRAENRQALSDWLNSLQESQNTWAAVVKSNVEPLANSSLSDQFVNGFRLGRNVNWKIHLYFKENPIMDIPFSNKEAHFLIQLPQRMRPGGHLPYINLLLQIALPLLLLCILSFLLYRYVMTPLKILEKAAKQFSAGNFSVRIKADIGSHNNEMTLLADTFDNMAERTSELIYHQRRLLADLSHEIRTPLARIDMAVDCVEQDIEKQKAIERLRYESSTMRELVEDALTLVWLNNEKPNLDREPFDLMELLQVICDDAQFEYPDNRLLLNMPKQNASLVDEPIDELVIESSQRALGQALENIVRNSLSHTPFNSEIVVSLNTSSESISIKVKDYGTGVPEHLLDNIFQPFFQVDKSRLEKNAIAPDNNKKRGGFGLGLALAQRQIEAVGGTVKAENHYQAGEHYSDMPNRIAGLQVIITLPFDG